MGCEHASTTTLLWLYGEADDRHAEHVASCAECTEVAELHLDVAASVSFSEPVAEPVPAPANRPIWAVLGGVSTLAVAAAAAVALWAGPVPSPADTGLTMVDDASVSAPLPTFDEGSDLDAELSELDADMDLLAQDLMTL